MLFNFKFYDIHIIVNSSYLSLSSAEAYSQVILKTRHLIFPCQTHNHSMWYSNVEKETLKALRRSQQTLSCPHHTLIACSYAHIVMYVYKPRTR